MRINVKCNACGAERATDGWLTRMSGSTYHVDPPEGGWTCPENCKNEIAGAITVELLAAKEER